MDTATALSRCIAVKNSSATPKRYFPETTIIKEALKLLPGHLELRTKFIVTLLFFLGFFDP